VLAFDTWFPEAEESSALRLIDELASIRRCREPARCASARREAFETDRRFSESLIARDVVLGFVFKQRLMEGEPRSKGALPAPMALDPEAVGQVRWVHPAGYTGNLAILQEAAAAGGFFDTPLVDEDGIVRRMPVFQLYEGQLYESLAFAAARLALASPPVRLAFTGEGKRRRLDSVELGEARIPVDENAAALVPFRGPVGSFLRFGARAQNLESRKRWPGESCCWARARGLLDIRATPVGKEYIGVEAHANMLAGILDSRIPFRPAAGPDRGDRLLVLALLSALWLSRVAARVSFCGRSHRGLERVQLHAWMRADGAASRLATRLHADRGAAAA
jgi:adenylate cyclase